ncbi:MAG: Gfo/Idh/MocA family oxidoreductase [Clostridia bacterium]|nr:Gfo/Idh/MocA family oxidoreductase [Clostridia bacterium]
MSAIKVAVIGCGTIANSAHIPSYMNCPDAEIKYFCDIIPERAEAAVKQYGCGIAVTDYKEVLADPEVSAVSVCTPNNMHPIISIDALKAGKHVLCEKAAARTWAEAKTMQDVQHETGLTLNIGVVNRFNPAVNEIKKLIDAGELGEVYHVYVSFRAHRSIPGLGGAFTTKEIAGGGALIDWGVHYLDIVMYCMGDPKPLTASGKAFSKLGVDMKNYVYEGMWAENTKNLEGTYDVDDSVTAFIRTDGPTITLNGAWAQNIGVPDQYIDFLGTKGGIRLIYGGDFTVYTTKDGKLHSYKPEYESSPMFQNEINAFVACVKSGEKLPSHIDRNILTSKLMQGIYDSSELGKEVTLD